MTDDGGHFSNRCRWFVRAAELGHVSSIWALGTAYAEGAGVPADPAMAARWFKRGAAMGDIECTRGLARLDPAARARGGGGGLPSMEGMPPDFQAMMASMAAGGGAGVPPGFEAMFGGRPAAGRGHRS